MAELRDPRFAELDAMLELEKSKRRRGKRPYRVNGWQWRRRAYLRAKREARKV